MLGWPVLGVWDGVSEHTDVDALCRSHHCGAGGVGQPGPEHHETAKGGVVATLGDHGAVRLARYPCLKVRTFPLRRECSLPDAVPVPLKDAECKVYHGHAAPPTGLRFLHDDSKLVTCGGKDACVFQWAHRDPRE